MANKTTKRSEPRSDDESLALAAVSLPNTMSNEEELRQARREAKAKLVLLRRQHRTVKVDRYARSTKKGAKKLGVIGLLVGIGYLIGKST